MNELHSDTALDIPWHVRQYLQKYERCTDDRKLLANMELQIVVLRAIGEGPHEDSALAKFPPAYDPLVMYWSNLEHIRRCACEAVDCNESLLNKTTPLQWATCSLTTEGPCAACTEKQLQVLGHNMYVLCESKIVLLDRDAD